MNASNRLVPFHARKPCRYCRALRTCRARFVGSMSRLALASHAALPNILDEVAMQIPLSIAVV
jgi:hypothetical protein